MTDYRRIAELSEGFPGIAIRIAQSIDDSGELPENILDLGDDRLIRRLIGSDEISEQEYKATKRVLEAFALFEKVEWENDRGEISEEARWIAEITGFDRDRDRELEFREIIINQKDRGILSGEYYLRVTPLPLATHLLGSWLKKHSASEIEDLFEQMPSDMDDRLGERIPFMASYDTGRTWISEKLSDSGMFYQNHGSVLETDWGSQLFLKFAEASPREAIAPLENFIHERSEDELRELRTGRREIVVSLQYAAVWDDLFLRAANLLVKLAVAENERYSNNATGTFADLFSPGYGRLAPTETPPSDRLPVLDTLLRSESKKRESLAIKAVESALRNPGQITKFVGPEYQGARHSPDLWTPDTYGELFDYYRDAWELLTAEIDTLSPEVRSEALDVLTGSVRSLAILNTSLSRMIRESLIDLLESELVDEEEIIQAAVDLTQYDSESLEELDGEKENWEELVYNLSESSYRGKLVRYIGLNLIADNEIIDNRIAQLAEISLEEQEQLVLQIPWLVTSRPNSRRVFEFGYEVGVRDQNNQFLSNILSAFRQESEDRDTGFLSGYLSALQERDEERRQEVLQRLFESEDSWTELVDIIRLSGITSDDAHRIVYLLESGEISGSDLRGFETGGVSRDIEPEIFDQIASLMLDSAAKDAATLLPIFFHYYVYPDDAPPLPQDLTNQLLTHSAFTEPQPDIVTSQGLGHEWKEVAQEFLRQYPEENEVVRDVVLETLDARQTIIGNSPGLKETLFNILSKDTEETWEEITAIIEKGDTRILVLQRWLSGDDSHIDEVPINMVPENLIWDWVEKNPEENARTVATLIPSQLFHSESEVCLARELLVKYGDREGVRNALSTNYGTDSWSGPSSEHYQKKKTHLEEFRENESDDNVLKWLNEEISRLSDQIKQAKKYEERLGF